MCNITCSALSQDVKQLKLDLQDAVIVKEEQEELLRRRERELTALKGALKEEVSAHDQEVDKLKEQYGKEIRRLQMSLEEVKQVVYHHPLFLSPPLSFSICIVVLSHSNICANLQALVAFSFLQV